MIRVALSATLAAAVATAVVGTAHADAPRWNLVADAGDSAAYIDQGSVAALGDAKTVWLLRNYPQTIDLGSDRSPEILGIRTARSRFNTPSIAAWACWR